MPAVASEPLDMRKMMILNVCELRARVSGRDGVYLPDAGPDAGGDGAICAIPTHARTHQIHQNCLDTRASFTE